MGDVINTYPFKIWVDGESFFSVFCVAKDDRYIDFSLLLQCTIKEAREYQYSKLYYSTQPDEPFHESRVICFQPVHIQSFEHIRLVLPKAANKSKIISLRIDGLPYTPGQFLIKDIILTSGNENTESSRLADLSSHRQWVREQVLQSEAEKRSLLPHYPESISVELTPRCNLRCPHCSSHGIPELHTHHNKKNEISLDLLQQIADDIFPHITALSLVGRGEPTLVNDKVWNQCMSLVQNYNVKVSCVTNGHFIKKRFTPDIIPYIDELCISMDGNTSETHRINRGGSSLQKVFDNVLYFHETRQALKLARRPKLSFYWTLMTNNIHELPDFIREAAKFEPDFFAIRHLVVFHDKDRHLSLLGHPQLTNKYLKEAYEELKKQGVKYEAPPLMVDNEANDVLPQITIDRNIIR